MAKFYYNYASMGTYIACNFFLFLLVARTVWLTVLSNCPSQALNF